MSWFIIFQGFLRNQTELWTSLEKENVIQLAKQKQKQHEKKNTKKNQQEFPVNFFVEFRSIQRLQKNIKIQKKKKKQRESSSITAKQCITLNHDKIQIKKLVNFPSP